MGDIRLIMDAETAEEWSEDRYTLTPRGIDCLWDHINGQAELIRGLMVLLKDIQWCGYDYNSCPACCYSRGNHASDCPLDALLKHQGGQDPGDLP